MTYALVTRCVESARGLPVDPDMVLQAAALGIHAPANDNVGSRAFLFHAPSTETMGTALDKSRTISALNELLRGELSAVESYDLGLPLITEDRASLADLRGCRASHQNRVDLLRRAVIQAGGEPVLSPGVWGAFARELEANASVLGSSLVIETLEKGEEHGLREYEALLPRMETEWRTVISNEALPQQRRTQNIVSSVRRMMQF